MDIGLQKTLAYELVDINDDPEGGRSHSHWHVETPEERFLRVRTEVHLMIKEKVQ